MALKPVLTLVSLSETADSFSVADATGNYNSTTNPGGFGSPNPTKGSISGVILRLTSLRDVNIQYNYRIPDTTDLFTANGIVLGVSAFVGAGSDGVFPDAVYDIAYDICYAGTGTVTFTNGSKQFTLTNANTLLANAVGIVFNNSSTVYLLDKTKALTSSGGYVTTALPSVDGAAQDYEIVYEGDLKFPIYSAGSRCLLEDIGIWNDNDCDEEFRDVWKRYRMQIALEVKFSKGLYYDAHNLIIKLASYCDNSNCGCS